MARPASSGLWFGLCWTGDHMLLMACPWGRIQDEGGLSSSSNPTNTFFTGHSWERLSLLLRVPVCLLLTEKGTGSLSQSGCHESPPKYTCSIGKKIPALPWAPSMTPWVDSRDRHPFPCSKTQ
jgi:hypothetical protein